MHTLLLGTVSSHAPVWGQRNPHGLRQPVYKSFKSCPRMGATRPAFYGPIRIDVSSHAPVWGQPLAGRVLAACGVVSSHAPVWGQPRKTTKKPESKKFQVMPPYGGNYNSFGRFAGPRSFKSCPRMGATEKPGRRWDAIVVSSHAPVWGQHSPALYREYAWKFQVMPPYGGNPIRCRSRCRLPCFKSCPRMGATYIGPAAYPVMTSFKSCPRMGATCGLSILRYRPSCFKSCPRMGATFGTNHNCPWLPSFKSCPRMGATHCNRYIITPHIRFQVMPPYGGNGAGRDARAMLLCFKSCPRMGAPKSRQAAPATRKFQVMPPYGGNIRIGIFSKSSDQFQVMPPYGGNW